MDEKFDVLDETGMYVGKVASREDCHKQGLWHRAVFAFIFNDKNEILLQKRSSNKKLWPNLWDVPVGGHVLAGEFGREALIRETKEEINLDICDNDIKFLVCTTSKNVKGDIINNHFNECYMITKNVDISKLKLQEEEVSDIKYFPKEEVLKRIENNYEGLTEKYNAWNLLKKLIND